MRELRIFKGIAAVIIIGVVMGCGGARRGVTVGPEVRVEGEPVEIPPSVEAELVTVGGSPEQLTFDASDNGLGSFHPAGDRIVYQSNRDGYWQIYELNLLIGSSRPLFSSKSNDENPVWTPDGTLLLYVSDRDGGGELNRNICFYTPDEDVSFPIVESDGDDWHPVPMDTVRFAFLSDRSPDPSVPAQERVNKLLQSEYFQQGQLETVIDSTHNFSAPTYIGGQRFIVRTPQARLAVFNTETGETQTLTPRGMRCGNADYSPVRNWVVFPCREGDEYGIYILDLAEKVYQRIMKADSEIRFPRFSPDGDWVLFSREIDGNFQLFRINVTAE